MDLNESQDLEVMDEDILFEICGNLPYDSSNDENWKIGFLSFLNAINGVQGRSNPIFIAQLSLIG